MASITFTGNLGREAELKFTPSGRPVLSFSVADSKSRKLDNGDWETLKEQWLNVEVWGDLAEFYAGKLPKGARVTVWGEFYSRKYESKDGTPGVSLDVTAKGIDILTRTNRQNNSGQGFESGKLGQWGGNQPPTGNNTPQEDPWATPAVANAGGWGSGPSDDTPPF